MKMKLGDVRKAVRQEGKKRQAEPIPTWPVTRKSIREEYLRGVPEFVIREATTTYIDTIRRYLFRQIQMTVKNPVQAREKMKAANEMLTELENEANELLENKLWSYVQST